MQTESALENKQKNSFLLINIITVAVPLVVAILLAFPNKLDLGENTKILPHFIGAINTLTSIFLILGLIFIKQKNVPRHRLMMTLSFFCGALFLIFYVTYHLTNPSNRFSGDGLARYFYLFVLISHIVLSIFVLPFVLRAMYFAVIKNFIKHRRIVRWAYPIWIYVSITGVIIYFMNYHLYPVK